MSKVLAFPTREAPRPGTGPVSAGKVLGALFLRLRTHYPGVHETLEAILEVLEHRRSDLPPHMPPADFRILQRYAEQYGWEHEYKKAQARAFLSDPRLEAEAQLATLLKLEADARVIFNKAAEAVKDGAGAAVDSTHYRTAWVTYKDLSDARQAAESALRRRQLEARDAAYRTRVVERFNFLLAEYKSYGAVYQELCMQLAEVSIRLELMRESERDVDPGDERALRDQHIKLIAQLQKHTEATKSETITKEVNESNLRLLELIEREVIATNPELWDRVVETVKKRLAPAIEGHTA